MFHVPATALLLTMGVCAAIHLGLYLWAKLHRVQIRRAWHLLPPLLAIPLFVGSSLTLQNHWRHQGILKSAQDWPYSEDSIPPEASNVFIDASYNSRHAKFHIDSAVLLSWCAQRKAKVDRLGGELPAHCDVFDAELHRSSAIEVTQGFAASNLSPDGGGFSLVYDSAAGVAYYRWSTH